MKKKFDIYINSEIISSGKPSKSLDAIASANPQHVMNRIKGFLPSGEECYVALRPGKGGMDFNKIMGGKVYAVAADGFSAIYEKDEKTKQKTTEQKKGR